MGYELEAWDSLRKALQAIAPLEMKEYEAAHDAWQNAGRPPLRILVRGQVVSFNNHRRVIGGGRLKELSQCTINIVNSIQSISEKLSTLSDDGFVLAGRIDSLVGELKPVPEPVLRARPQLSADLSVLFFKDGSAGERKIYDLRLGRQSPSSPEATKNKGGRPPDFRWDEIVDRLMVKQGALDTHARVIELAREAARESGQREPSEKAVRDHFAKHFPRFWAASTSKP